MTSESDKKERKKKRNNNINNQEGSSKAWEAELSRAEPNWAEPSRAGLSWAELSQAKPKFSLMRLSEEFLWIKISDWYIYINWNHI